MSYLIVRIVSVSKRGSQIHSINILERGENLIWILVKILS